MSLEVEAPLSALRAMLPDLDPEARTHYTFMADQLEAMERHAQDTGGRMFPDAR